MKMNEALKAIKGVPDSATVLDFRDEVLYLAVSSEKDRQELTFIRRKVQTKISSLCGVAVLRVDIELLPTYGTYIPDSSR